MEKLNVNNTILLYAMRYALKRNTTAPEFVGEAIRDNINEIDDETLRRMQEEIDKEMESFEPRSKYMWKEIRDTISKERISRSKLRMK